MAGSAADNPGGAAGGREVLAFDLYGTLEDLLALSRELGQVLGDSDGREAARLWRLKQLEYSFRLTAMSRYQDFRWVTSRALDFALASPAARLPDGRGRVGLSNFTTTCSRSRTAVPALRALAMGYEFAVFSTGTPAMIANCLDNSRPGGLLRQADQRR